MDSPTRDTPVEHEANVPTVASREENQHTEDMEPQSITALHVPRTTAAAEAPIASFPADLAGVGSAYNTTHLEFPKGSIDDEFTAETTHNDGFFQVTSISCDLAGG